MIEGNIRDGKERGKRRKEEKDMLRGDEKEKRTRKSEKSRERKR